MPSFEVGQTYKANESNIVEFRITHKTKCFVTVQLLRDGEEDWMFKGSGKAKIRIINNKEYFDFSIYSCFAQ